MKALVLIILCLSVQAKADPISLKDLEGKWEPLSRNFLSTLGNMQVSREFVSWAKLSQKTKVKIIFQDRDVMLLELATADADCGKFLRLGPLEDKAISLSFYIRKNDFKKSSDPNSTDGYSIGCSWGKYLKSSE